MHIAEGIIKGTPALVYTGIGVSLMVWGTAAMKRFVARQPEKKPLLGMAAALVFFVSLIPLPAFTGTTTHPCGTPFVAILLGPAIGTALAGISLLLQAAFFAHGGFSTWGANVLDLGLLGCLFGWGAFRVARMLRLPIWAAGFAGGLLGDLAVYAGAGLILGTTLAHGPSPQYTLNGYLAAIYAAYLPTQLPIAVGEMLLTGLALHYAFKQRPEVLDDLGVLSKGWKSRRASLAALILAGILIPLFLPDPGVSLASGTQLMTDTHEDAAASPERTPMPGMDEAVNKRLAEEGGLPARDPYINMEAMGGLWNTLLLLAGGVCGFILGRWSHLLWGRKAETLKQPVSAART
jgi:cobalt/nickel transport system permease protein